MRICLVHVYQRETSPASVRYYEQCMSAASKVKRPDTQLEMRWPKPGVRGATDIHSLYFSSLVTVQVIEKIVEAWKEGFDAVVVLCWYDTGVAEASEIVDIPVVGEAEASMHLACMLGDKFAVIAGPEYKWIRRVEKQIWAHGLQDRAIPNPVERPVLPDGTTFDDLYAREVEQPGTLASFLQGVAKKCVERNAEVVIIGSTGESAALTAGGISKVEGLDVPIIDSIAAAVKVAELRVDLKQSLGLPSISRAALYSRPSDKLLNRVRKLFGLPGL